MTLFLSSCYLKRILSQAKMLSILPHQKRFVVFNFNPSPFTRRCCFMICSRIFDDRYLRYMMPVSSVGPNNYCVLAAALQHFHVTSPTLRFDPQFVWASVSLVKFYALVKRSWWHLLVGLFCSKTCLSCAPRRKVHLPNNYTPFSWVIFVLGRVHIHTYKHIQKSLNIKFKAKKVPHRKRPIFHGREFPPCLQVRSPANPGRLAPPSPDHHRVPSGNMNFPNGKVVEAKLKSVENDILQDITKKDSFLCTRKMPDYIAWEFGWIRCNMLFWQSILVSCKANSEQRYTLYGGWHGHAANQRPGSEDFQQNPPLFGGRMGEKKCTSWTFSSLRSLN